MRYELPKNEYILATQKQRTLKAFSKEDYFADWLATNQSKFNIKFMGNRHDLIAYVGRKYSIDIKAIQIIIQDIADKMIGIEYKELRWFVIYHNPDYHESL
jgi:hypothetical protein